MFGLFWQPMHYFSSLVKKFLSISTLYIITELRFVSSKHFSPFFYQIHSTIIYSYFGYKNISKPLFVLHFIKKNGVYILIRSSMDGRRASHVFNGA